MSDKLTDLLPCPSGHKELRREYDDEFEVHWIGCNADDCEWRTCGKTETEAITAWNTRTQQNSDVLREAARVLLASASDTYRKANGHIGSIQADDGEKCWIVHSDEIESLRAALAQGNDREAVLRKALGLLAEFVAWADNSDDRPFTLTEDAKGFIADNDAALAQENTRTQQRNDVLREALEPFAVKAKLIEADTDDDYCPDWSPFIAVKHYRRAADALATLSPKDQAHDQD